MTKQKLNIARLILVAVLVIALSSAVCLVAFAEDEAAAAQTRIYNESFDRLLDDGHGEGAAPAYRSVSWEAGKCDDLVDPIFKVGSPKISAGFETMQIVLRSPDESIKLADLKIAFRVTDDNAVAEANSYVLTDEKIAGAITLSGSATDIGAEWTAMTLDLTQADFGEDKDIDTTKTNALLAIHLYTSASTIAGKLDIQKVSVLTGANETVIWNFDDIKEMWWGESEGGTYVDYPASYAITDSKKFVSAEGNLDEEYSAIVLSACGSGTVTVAPIDENGTVGTAKAWADLKDLEGTAVSAIGGEYVNHVISLESLGATKIKGVQVAVTGGTVELKQAFFTNMESRAATVYFPVIDTNSIVYMSQFNFEYTTVGDNYDKAVEDCASFNLNYILSYHNPSAITDGHLVLDANGQDYTQMKINSKVGSDGRQYLVIKYKLQNGATLNDFRINHLDGTSGDVLGGSQPVYANQMVAGFGLPSLSAVNPYQAEGGYSYLIVDCKETFNSTNIAGFDIYFSGEGQMLIDEIYYADVCIPELDVENKLVFDDYSAIPDVPAYWWTDISDPSKLSIEEGALKVEVPAGTDICIGGAKDGNNKQGNHRYMVMRMKSENLDMSTFRIAWDATHTSFANAGGFVTLDGKEYVLGEEYADFVIDLDASGINRAIEGYRLWIGGWNEEAGTLYIDEVYFADTLVKNENKYSVSKTFDEPDEAGYHYIAGGDFANVKSAPTVELSLTAPNTFVYEGFRFEFKLKDGSKVEYGVAHGLKFADPVVLDEGEEAQELTQKFVIDLASIGIPNCADVTEIHMHMNEIKVAGTVKLDVNYIDYIPSVADIALPVNDDSKPVISHSIAATGKVGTEITLNATAADNYDESVTVSYEVTLGSDKITVTNGKFTPAAAGTYSVKITATDNAGNVATENVAITVAANQPTNPDPEKPQGLSTGAIVGIVLGCVAVVAAGVVAFILIRKKKAGK